ncbi:MAG: hypothetical protein LJE60_13835 [Thiocapsa sp.]|nr:hypothetical protein [Thiocapsa sp.]
MFLGAIAISVIVTALFTSLATDRRCAMESIAEQLIPFAVRAPSGHNAQPWQFSVNQDRIRIFPDLSRRLPVVDPDDHALFISLGCALENVVVAASHLGLAASIDSGGQPAGFRGDT